MLTSAPKSMKLSFIVALIDELIQEIQLGIDGHAIIVVVGITDQVSEIREIGCSNLRLFEIGAHIRFLYAKIGIDVGEEIALDAFHASSSAAVPT